MSNKKSDSDASSLFENLSEIQSIYSAAAAKGENLTALHKMRDELSQQNAVKEAFTDVHSTEIAKASKSLQAINSSAVADFRESIREVGKIQTPDLAELATPTLTELATDQISTELETSVPSEPVSAREPKEVEISPEEVRNLMQDSGQIVECPDCEKQFLTENADFTPHNEHGDRVCSRCRDADKGIQ